MEGQGLATLTLGVITRRAPPLASDGSAGPAGTRVNITSNVIWEEGRRVEEKLAYFIKIKAIFRILLSVQVQIAPLGLGFVAAVVLD